MKAFLSSVVFASLMLAASSPADDKRKPPHAAPDKKSVLLTAGGTEFASYIYQGYPKPVVYPILGPGGVAMTRKWPLEAAAPGEETDHPHHQGLWFNHGSVNGIDFWAISDKSGKIVVTEAPVVEDQSGGTRVKSKEEWRGPDGTVVCRSQTTVSSGVDGEDRYLDYTITITATEGDVTLGDTKEGTMAIRTRPELNLKGAVAKGQAVNSEGVTGAAIWAKHAKWVDYWAPVNGHTLGIACFDHPSNLRHPTTWHARDYGLIAANPFGLHDFEKQPKGAGDHPLKMGESLTFKYRWLFHAGDAKTAKIAERWEKWSKQP